MRALTAIGFLTGSALLLLTAAPASAQNAPARDDIVAKLEKLNELRIAGLLTDEEFAQQKARILDQL